MGNLELLNPECFIFELYESCWWNLFEDMSWDDSLNRGKIKRIILQYAVGYCEGNRLIVRPKNDFYGVMFEKDGERFWFHLEKDYFEK